MEHLIQELNDPVNQSVPGKVHDLQKRIQAIQRDKSAWQIGLDLLRHEDATVRFYGALTLTIKINSDWQADGIAENEDASQSLLQGLLESYVRLTNASDQTFVLRKVCSALTAFFIKSTAELQFPVVQVYLGFLGRGMDVKGENIDMGLPEPSFESITVSQSRALLWLCLDLAEEVDRLDKNTRNGAKVTSRLALNTHHVYSLIETCLRRLDKQSRHYSCLSGPSLLEQGNTENGRLTLSLIPLWSQLYLSESSAPQFTTRIPTRALITQCIDLLFVCFEQQVLAENVLQTLTSLIQSQRRVLQKSYNDKLEQIVVSHQAREWVQCLHRGDFSPAAVNFVEFLIALIESSDPSTPAHIARNNVFDILKILQSLLSCKGAAVVEDEVCQMVLECLGQVVEGFNDWVGSGMVKGNLRRLVLDICFAATAKAQYPPEQMDSGTQTWDEDDCVKFQDFRNDVQDVLDYAFAVSGPPLAQQLAEHIFASRPDITWSEFESGFFVLSAFTESMIDAPEEYDAVVDAVLQVRQREWQMALSDGSVPVRVRQAIIRFLNRNAGYLERHVGQLVPCLEFLFSALTSPGCAPSAALAIRVLCSLQRTLLVEALPQFLNSLKIASNLGSFEKQSIFRSVAAIVQALPAEVDKIGPLTTILEVVRSQHEIAQASAGSVEDKVSSAVDTVQTLAAVCEETRAPSTTVIDLESPENSQASFWTAGPGTVVQQQALRLCFTIAGQAEFNTDPGIIEAACNFLRSGYPESHPSPFKFLPEISADFLSSQIRPDCPRIEAVMNCATSFLASSSPEALTPFLPLLLEPIFNTYQTTLNQPPAGTSTQLADTDFASSTLEFLNRLLPKWAPTWFSPPDASMSLSLTLELTFLLLSNPDTLPRRTAAAFLASLLSISGPSTSLAPPASTTLSSILSTYNPRILATLLPLLAGGCARSELDTLTSPLRSFITHQPLPAQSLLREAMLAESGVLSASAVQATTVEQRLRFVAQLIHLKGGWKTAEVVRQFWIMCRGEGFGYVT